MGYNRNQNNNVSLDITKAQLEQILINRKGDVLVKEAKKAGDKLGRTLTTNQIRAIFGSVRRIEKTWTDKDDGSQQDNAIFKLQLLKPKMKYQAKRDGRKGSGLDALADVLSQAIDIVANETGNKRDKFLNFVQFFEAILAYHKVAGGR